MAKRIRTKPFENPATVQKVQRSIDTLAKDTLMRMVLGTATSTAVIHKNWPATLLVALNRESSMNGSSVVSVLVPFGIGLLVMWQAMAIIRKEKRFSGWKRGRQFVPAAGQRDSRMVVLVDSALPSAG